LGSHLLRPTKAACSVSPRTPLPPKSQTNNPRLYEGVNTGSRSVSEKADLVGRARITVERE
jgi:hypothetical protein